MDAQTATAEIAACFPDLRLETAVEIPGGWDNLTLEVNGSLIFRVPHGRANWRQLETEIKLLPRLAPALPTPIPEFKFVGHARDGKPIVGYGKIPGTPLRFTDGAPPGGGDLARSIGEALAALHRFPAQEAAGSGAPAHTPAEWRESYRQLRSAFRGRVAPSLDAPARRAVDVLWSEFLERDDYFRFRSALIHSDLESGHLLIAPSGGKLAGIIDWGDAAIGDPALDFAGVRDECGPAFAALVLDAYQGNADATLLDRARFYSAIAPIYEVLLGLDTGDDGHVDRGLARLQSRIEAG